ncbi:MAG: hypothetical protein RIQ52_1723 [Pseudomonadota bacterium]
MVGFMQIILLTLLVGAALYFFSRHADTVMRRIHPSQRSLWLLVATVLLLLGLTGKLSWVFPLMAAMAAAVARLMPVLMKLLAVYQHWLQHRRQHHTHHQHQDRAGASGKTGMTREEALEVLGLNADAQEDDIIQAHRRLMQKVHPDRGGSHYLASRINLARQVLLG